MAERKKAGRKRSEGSNTPQLRRREVVAGVSGVIAGVLLRGKTSPARAADQDNLVLGTTNWAASTTDLVREGREDRPALRVGTDAGAAIVGEAGLMVPLTTTRERCVGVRGAAAAGIGVLGASGSAAGDVTITGTRPNVGVLGASGSAAADVTITVPNVGVLGASGSADAVVTVTSGVNVGVLGTSGRRGITGRQPNTYIGVLGASALVDSTYTGTVDIGVLGAPVAPPPLTYTLASHIGILGTADSLALHGTVTAIRRVGVHGLCRASGDVEDFQNNAVQVGAGVRAEHTGDGLALEVLGKARFSTSGRGVIAARRAHHVVEDASVTPRSHISVALTGRPGKTAVQWVEPEPGVGFVVHLTRRALRPIPFTYLIIEIVEGA